jgi:hypothetical protein
VSAKGFLDGVEEKKRMAAAHGWTLDLVILPLEFEAILFAGVMKEAIPPDAYRVTDTDVLIHGVRVMWSEKPLPKGQCWFRYSGQKA